MDIQRKLWGLAVASLLTLAVSLVLLSLRLPLMRIRQDVSDGYKVDTSSDRSIAQTFFSYYPGLTAISVRITEPWPPDDQLLTFHLQPLSDETDAWLTVTARLGELRTDDWLHWTFEPLDDTEAKAYRLIIETAAGAPLWLAAHSGNMYLDGELSGGGDMVFEARYNGQFWPTLLVLMTQLASDKPGLAGQPAWYVVLFGAYGLAVSGLVVNLVSWAGSSRLNYNRSASKD